MNCRLPGALCGVLVGCALLLPSWSAAWAADVETRDFNVFVDGKRAGAAHMTIQNTDDGAVVMSCDTELTVSIFFFTYTYKYRGRELWKDGKLQRFDSTCNDDGKRYLVTATAEDKGIRVKVNNVERIVGHDVWLTSYWAKPAKKMVNQVVPLVDADTGRDLECTVAHVGAEDVMVSGQSQNLQHYKLTGQVQVDLWYDAADRLARQEFIEEGHRTIVELTKIRK